MPGIIGIIVFEGKGGNVIKTFHHATFAVKIREAQGTADLVHSVFLAESNDSLQQGTGNLLVVDEIHPAETDLCVLPVPVGNLIDNGYHPAGHLSVLVCQEFTGFTILAHRIPGGIQGA